MAMDAPATAASEALLTRRESVAIGGEQATAELARSLPELVEQLRALRVAMEKSAKVYDAISAGELKTHQAVAPIPAPVPISSTLRSSGGSSSSIGNSVNDASHYKYNAAGRQSIFTPFADSGSDADRLSLMTPQQGFAEQLANRHSAPLELGDLSGGTGLYRHGSKRGQQLQQQPPQQFYQQHPGRPEPQRRSAAFARNVDYTVMWVSGECGISLRNFSPNKIGAQVAVLQQAEGVTTGIANCRLGDQLITVNDDPVETATFKEIVQKLKTTRRPITLGFRTNQNMATSPVSGPRMRPGNGARHSSARGLGSTRSFFPTEEESAIDGRQSLYAPAPVLARTSSSKSEDLERGPEERTTDASVRSSVSTLSDEIESWCKEQEEMHSDIIVLLTETVMRCEKLQQENMDQLQNWLQVAPTMYTSPPSSLLSAAAAALPKSSSAYTLKSNASDQLSDSEQ